MEGIGMSIMRAVGQAADVLRLLPIGGPSCCNIAVTNVCNATCDFCNYAKDKDFVTEKKWLDPERLSRALDILHARGVRYITFSGGEPMLHPQMCEMISAVAFRGMRPAMVTNGSALTEKNMRELAEAGGIAEKAQAEAQILRVQIVLDVQRDFDRQPDHQDGAD